MARRNSLLLRLDMNEQAPMAFMVFMCVRVGGGSHVVVVRFIFVFRVAEISVGTPSRPQPKGRSSVWWLSPATLVGFNVIIVFAAYGQSENAYLTEYDSQKWISGTYVVICLIALLVLLAGSYFGYWGLRKRNPVKKAADINAQRLRTAFFVTAALCFAAYCIWYLNFIRLNGLGSFLSFLNFDNLSSNVYSYKENSGSISGVTTFTEVGVVSAILGAMLIQNPEEPKEGKRKIGVTLCFLLCLSIIRALLFSERLAVLELVVPFAISWFGLSQKPLDALDRWLPVAAVALVIVLFGAFEYVRSWLNHYVYYYDSYFDFILTRILGYYTNAANTEAMYIEKGVTSWLPPYWSIQWLWRMPVVGGLYEVLAETNVSALFNQLLAVYANPEYNNPGGILVFYKDFSWAGMVLYFAFGYLLGRFYYGFQEGNQRHRIWYPILYLTMLELPRYFYLSNQRGFVVVLGVLIVLFVAGRASAGEIETSGCTRYPRATGAR